MGIQERKERERSGKQLIIIRAARDLFLHKGVESTSMQDIANRAEISKGSIYSYFKDKEALLQDILFGAFMVLKELLVKSIAPSMTGLDKLHAMGKAYITFYRDHPQEFFFTGLVEILGLPTHMGQESDTPFGILLQELKDFLLQSTLDGVKDGSLRPTLDCGRTSLVLAQTAMGFIQKLAQVGDEVRTNTGYAAQELITEMFHLMIHSIKNDQIKAPSLSNEPCKENHPL